MNHSICYCFENDQRGVCAAYQLNFSKILIVIYMSDQISFILCVTVPLHCLIHLCTMHCYGVRFAS